MPQFNAQDVLDFFEEAEEKFKSRKYNARELFDAMKVVNAKCTQIIHAKSINQESLYSKVVRDTGYSAQKDTGVNELLRKLKIAKEDDPQMYLKILWKQNTVTGITKTDESSTHYPAAIVWASQWQRQQGRKYIEILEYDDTFDTNDAGYKCGLLVGINEFKKTIIVGQCFQMNLTIDSFKFVWRSVYELLGNMLPSLMMTDEDGQMAKGLQVVYDEKKKVIYSYYSMLFFLTSFK